MMKQLVMCGVFGAVLFAGNVLAECPKNLSAEQMYDCIVVEGAGGEYQAAEADTNTTVSQDQSGNQADDANPSDMHTLAVVVHAK